MNTIFNNLFKSGKTPNWLKSLLKVILLIFISGIGVILTISSIKRSDIFGIILASIYNLFMIVIFYYLIKARIKKQ